MNEHTFEKNVWNEIVKANKAESEFGAEAKKNLNLTLYNAVNRALVSSFNHSAAITVAKC